MHPRKIAISYLVLLFSSYFIPGLTYAEVLPAGILKLDGRLAPALVLSDMDGKSYDLHQSRGHWVFVHFWATWCGPCRKEMPTIAQVHPQFAPQQLEFVLINTAEYDDVVFEFIGIVAPDLSPLMDRDGLVTEVWQPRGLPASFFVDPKGHLRYLALGGRDWSEPVYMDFLKHVIKSDTK